MNSYIHAKNSAKNHGGVPEDYLPVHDFIDQTKAHLGDIRHRAIFHNSWGCFMAEKFLGHVIINSEGKKVPVRVIAEEHIFEDLGCVPTLADCLRELPMTDLLSRKYTVRKIEYPKKEETGTGT